MLDSISKDNAKLIQDLLPLHDSFESRHNGLKRKDEEKMLAALELSSLDELVYQVVPDNIRRTRPLDLPQALTESELLADMRTLADKNKVFRSFIGLGYADTITPPVILRNILENPGWYTQYTPYQAEIAQGRMEALLNFQTMIIDLTGMDIANASLLDEATAAAEAMALAFASRPRKSNATTFFVSEKCHPQTIDTVIGRAEPLGIEVVVGDHQQFAVSEEVFGILLQYPATDGTIYDYQAVADAAHEVKALVTVAVDLLALTIMRSPAEFGADIVVGNSQRFGVPMGYGGPHAAFLATTEAHKRQMPGRIIGVSVDRDGNPALRLALQTREQHIRREKATSNICTAQVLLAVMASMYAVYHGPEGLTRIARRVQLLTRLLARVLQDGGYTLASTSYFDTIKIVDGPRKAAAVQQAALADEINLRYYDDGAVGITLDEPTTLDELKRLAAVFGLDPAAIDWHELALNINLSFGENHNRQTSILPQEIFNHYHTETEMVRYIYRLQSKDLSLVHSMIPLGSCTMKLNATTEMIPITWPEFAHLHPFVPLDQAAGYHELFRRLEEYLAEITDFDAVSLQPNAGSQGEYSGLMVIRAFHKANGQPERNVCLIPSSAHGTNPASAVMAGMKVVIVKCDDHGNIDVADLKAKVNQYEETLAALMVTYPSTHGVFETEITQICDIIHAAGGQVYMDGANLNALVGISSPGLIGADVCHLNLHKTFCIPHGGGGPGMGPICVKSHLAPYLPGHVVVNEASGPQGIRAIAAAPWGSPSILPISYAYIRLMGPDGLLHATQQAILSANYVATRLEPHFPVLYRGAMGWVAHECIIDTRQVKEVVSVDDIAKRLMDYGFHAPTMSWPVIGTMMIEPTESESIAELDRFCEAMITIRQEIAEIESGELDAEVNPLTMSPHTAAVIAGEWERPYARKRAVYPLPWVRQHKFWPSVGRVDNVYGDRNLVCTCEPLESYID
ncbi:MAG: aminomethyl-transferring glycine dehydrogenase [Ardenticatenaceae bacterium]|nr:aminomethyl-transferring glycine dehydrogenase [Ardenticatenaceae bacterium]